MSIVGLWQRVVPTRLMWIALLLAASLAMTGSVRSAEIMTAFLVIFSMTLGATKLKALRDHWNRITQGQRLQVVAIIGTLVVVLWSIKAATTASHQEIVRQQFRLPADTVFKDFKSRKRGKSGGERIEAIVRFSDRDFWNYALQADDAQLWQPVAFKYEGRLITGTYDEDAARWEWSPRPAFAGAARVRWGHLSREQERHAPNRRTLCFAAVQQPLDAVAQAGPQNGASVGVNDGMTETFKISACRNVPRNERPFVYVLAVLDYDTKSLHVLFN